jgi:hypothetical protein
MLMEIRPNKPSAKPLSLSLGAFHDYAVPSHVLALNSSDSRPERSSMKIMKIGHGGFHWGLPFISELQRRPPASSIMMRLILQMPGIRKVIGAVLLLGLLTGLIMSCSRGPISLLGVVIERNTDPHKRSPIDGVEVTASLGSRISSVQTDSSGYFNLKLRGWMRNGQTIHLQFTHPGYRPVSMNVNLSDKLYVVDMEPVSPPATPKNDGPSTVISNVKIHYSMKAAATMNVGSAAKTFDVVNTGNVPCDGQLPCSPDGKWKASIGSLTVNAGQDNEFRNVRLSCIAGPCPFTKVQSDRYSKGGNEITASVLDWSDTTTFLLEAEVYHPMVTDVIEDSYPVIFGRTLNFSVPDTGEGVSIEADVNGELIIFPLGPGLYLSWANCTAAADKDHGKSYRCELKDGYNFP